MADALYTIDILRLAASTPEWPALASPHGSAERRSPTCGSRVRVDVTTDERGHVAGIGLQLSACALGQASCAIMAKAAVGQDVEAFRAARGALAGYLAGTSDELPQWPHIVHLAPARAYPARHASILLAFDAAIAALEAAENAGQKSYAHG